MQSNMHLLIVRSKLKSKKMKKILFTTLLCVMNVLFVIAQGTAEITFEKTSYNFGSFSESSPKVTCKFKFKNTGDGPLVIHQAIASCGCTVPQYPKEPIKPGESGEVTVTYHERQPHRNKRCGSDVL